MIIKNHGVFQGIHQVDYPDSSSCQDVSNENFKETFVSKQLPFFIFPPTRVHLNHQKHLMKSNEIPKGKCKVLGNQSLHEYDIEKTHMLPPKEKSVAQ